ncbi:MAG: NifU family protein [Sandaracinaceae bacterium]|jgi:hypothetical protein|nr:NifU family protein [Sandaracinaceae bacterium]MBP7681128.1 NifU family protein [Deltaproteobacteria bacterium]MBK6812629.1 NifU family protein [Sandaracinaceae bacterium]MBK7155565.1 NifU family protein [Sandaracinaceae bacterium]MBK7777009.1 NifU family protein [Sandaracinaceae bacterium]
MKERVQTVIDEVLRPLLEADGGGVDLLHVGPTRVSLRLRGKAAYSVGGRYIRTLVIEPLLRKASGVPDLEVVLEDEVTRPRSLEMDASEVMREIEEQEARDRAGS